MSMIILEMMLVGSKCSSAHLLHDIRFHLLRQALQRSKLFKQFRILLLEEYDNLCSDMRLLLRWDIVNDTLRYQTLDGVLCIHRREFT